MVQYGKNLMLAVAGTAILAGCGSPLTRVRLTGAPTEELTAVPVNSDLAAGKRALADGQYGAAVAALRLARLDPACTAEATNGLGVAYAQLGRNDLAERYFREAVAMDPQDRRFAANLARFEQTRAVQLAARPAPSPVVAPAPQLKAGLRVASGGGSKAVSVGGTAPVRPLRVAAPEPVKVGEPAVRTAAAAPASARAAAKPVAVTVDPAPTATARLTVVSPRPIAPTLPSASATRSRLALAWQPPIHRTFAEPVELD